MKKTRLWILCLSLLLAMSLFCGCEALMQTFDDTAVRQRVETMVDALIADDMETGYALVSHLGNQEDFAPVFGDMQEILGSSRVYELSLLSIRVNKTVTNGQPNHTASAVYELRTGRDKLIVSIQTAGEDHRIQAFHITPYNNTDYYYTGTLSKMNEANGLQWIFLLSNVLSLGFAVFALVDCCRHRFKRKVLWILLVIFGFFTLGITVGAGNLRINYHIGWIAQYTALIRYGSGATVVRFMLPAGALAYWLARRSLLTKNGEETAAQPPEITDSEPA